MYSNAGIRSHHTLSDINTLPNNRHVPTTSDPPYATNNPFSSLSSLNIFGGHAARRSEDGILSASAAPLRSASVQANWSTGRTTTTVFAPPSSFHAQSKTSTSVSNFSRNASHVASSYNINHNKAPSGSSTSLFLPRTALSKPVAQSTRSVSRSSSISHRNGSNCSGVAPAEPAAPQRLNMKRLMSKPTAILVPDRAQSAMAFAPPSDMDDSRSIEDHLAIKLRSLDILRRSRRRSRSVDLMMNYGVPSSYPLRPPEGPLHRTATSIGLPSTSEAARFLAGEEYARDLRSSNIPKTSRPAPILLPNYDRVEPRSLNSEEENFNSPGFPLSPASVIALTWTKSQKRVNSSSTIAGLGEPSPSSSIPQPGLTVLECLDSTSVSSPVVFADANEVSYQIDLSSPPIITNSPAQIFEDARECEYFTPWAVAEQGQSPRSQPVTRDASSPATKGEYECRKVGVTATMREVSRRFTGAFGRREKKQEKPAKACLPINHHAPSFSMASVPPNLESNSSSFSSNPVSKAPKSHERAGSLTSSHITTAVKNEPLPNNQLLQTLNPPPVVHCKPADSIAFSTEFGQLCHTPLTIRTDASPQASISERDSSFEVTTPRQPPALEMPNWSLLHSSSSRRATVDENGQELNFSRQTSNQPSPISPFVFDRGRIPTTRSNTLKKRSRPSLRAKPSASTVSGIATEGTETIGVHSTHVPSSTPPSLSLSEGTVTGGKLRGLARSLSSGTLAQSSSQSDRSRSPHTRGSSPEIHGTGADDVPPVPQIPKDFEMILDADAYFAERARLLREGKIDSDGESIPSGQGHGGPNTTRRIPSSSQMFSHHSSFLGHKEQVLADVSSLPSSLTSRLRVDTEPERAVSSSKQPPVSVPVRRKQPPSVYDAYTFPKRVNPTMEHSSSTNSRVDYIGSSSPAQSYLHTANTLYSTAVTEIASGSFEEKKSLLSHSHSHSMVSPYPNSILAQPIMPPKDLYQHGEDEAAALRRQQSKDASTNHFVQKKRSSGALPAGRSVVGNQEQSPAKPPPPTISPSLLPLTAPPPRPPRRVTRVRSSTVLDNFTRRPTHHHQRSLSSPTSPTIPVFLTTKIDNPLPSPNRSRSVGSSPPSPQSSTSTEALPSTQGKRARSNSVGKKAKYLPPLALRPRRSESVSNVSPNPASGERSTGEGGSQPKVRVKTSLGTITWTKSVVTPKSSYSPKSASHTPSSSASYTHSPQSSGPRSSLSRTSRDHSFGHGWDDGEAPPLPFTSTAFTFKEISPVSGPSPAKGKALTEGEREDLWNALLSRSDRVGGTLTITLDQTEGSALLSDKASFRED